MKRFAKVIGLIAIGVGAYFVFQLIFLALPKEFSDEEVADKIEKYTYPESFAVSEDDNEENTETLFFEGYNRLIIPNIGADIGIMQGNESVLEQGIWHRYPERGNPVIGGNFILSGHRLNIGATPEGTARSSPLYNIHNVSIGQELIVTWEGKSYTYEVFEIKTVSPNEISIENQSADPILTLYTCTQSGAADGREVFLARLK